MFDKMDREFESVCIPQHATNLLQGVPLLRSFNSTDITAQLLEALKNGGFRCSAQNHPFISHQSNYLDPTGTHYLRKLGEAASDNSSVALDIAMVFVCIVCAGFASGLTQGLLSLDFTEMTIKSRSGSPIERIQASKVLPVISRHHLLLVSLMLWNAAATEALPIFLSGLVPEYLAIIISVTLVLFVGEIIPAAILTGPKQLSIAANLLPLVFVVIVIFYPIAYPISYALDYALGITNIIIVLHINPLLQLNNITYEASVVKFNDMIACMYSTFETVRISMTGSDLVISRI